MIARIWRSTTTASNAAGYQEYLNRCVIPVYQAAEGNRGVYIMNERQSELVHFLFMVFWTSPENMTDYFGHAGDVINPSPEEKAFLVAFESVARHYKIINAFDE